jgi:hypothetical protein
MNTRIVYKLGILHLIYLLMKIDDEIDFREVNYFQKIRKDEDISEELLLDFKDLLNTLDDQAIFNRGIKLISLCNESEKTRAFSILCQVAEADGKVNESEVRFLADAGNEIRKVRFANTSQKESNEVTIYLIDRNKIDLRVSEKVFAEYFKNTSIEPHTEIELAIESLKNNRNKRSLLFLAIDLNRTNDVNFVIRKLHANIDLPTYALIEPSSLSSANFNSLLISPFFSGFLIKPLKRYDMLKISQENSLHFVN